MFCPFCGTKNRENARFCSGCGRSILVPTKGFSSPRESSQAIGVTLRPSSGLLPRPTQGEGITLPRLPQSSPATAAEVLISQAALSLATEETPPNEAPTLREPLTSSVNFAQIAHLIEPTEMVLPQVSTQALEEVPTGNPKELESTSIQLEDSKRELPYSMDPSPTRDITRPDRKSVV